jgi:hypothetical protein
MMEGCALMTLGLEEGMGIMLGGMPGGGMDGGAPGGRISRGGIMPTTGYRILTHIVYTMLFCLSELCLLSK